LNLERRAIIIASPDEDIPGVLVDEDNWLSYLSSPYGGAWEKHEISVLRNPRKDKLIDLVNSFKGIEYLFIAFSGHGYEGVTFSGFTETILCINESEKIRALDLNPIVPRCTMILDSCRGLRYLKESHELVSNMSKIAVDREELRSIYNKQISISEKGNIIINSCDLAESADEDEVHGGFFTYLLIQCGKEWYLKENHTTRVFNVSQAYDCAKLKLKQNRIPQNPTIRQGRRVQSFPFAVK